MLRDELPAGFCIIECWLKAFNRRLRAVYVWHVFSGRQRRLCNDDLPGWLRDCEDRLDEFDRRLCSLHLGNILSWGKQRVPVSLR